MDYDNQIKSIKYVYIAINDGCDWDEQIIFLEITDAINYSYNYKNARVEIFEQSTNDSRFIPTYSYYKDGILYENK
jgi:hypothetical protein